jgi:peptide/nickel transport system substrate-binding protein/oligopeptide transport system substrate-binding protein
VLVSACTATSDPSPVATPTFAEPAAPADAGSGTLRWAVGADPGSLDPRDATTADERVLVGGLFDGLTTLSGDDAAVVPALATTWSSDPAGTTWTFLLDPSDRWHDGTPVVADDVVRAWRRVLASPSGVAPAAALLDNVVGAARARAGGALDGLSTPDDTTLVVRLVHADPDLPRLLTHPGLAPVPPLAEDDPAAFAEAPIGNGPYALGEPWAHNQFLRLVAVPDHPRPGRVDEVVFRIYAGDDEGLLRYADLTQGSLQVGAVPPGLREQARAEFGVSGRSGDVGVHDDLLATTSLLLLDTTAQPLDDVRVRRAIALLVDRASLADMTGGERIVARTLVPPSVAGAPTGTCSVCRFDPGAAAALLEAARGDLPEGELLAAVRVVSSSDGLHRTMAADLVARLEANGVPAEVVLPSAAAYLDTATDLEGVAVRLAWAPPGATLGSWLGGLVGPTSLGAGLTGYRSRTLDVLREQAVDPVLGRQRVAEQLMVRHLLDRAVVVPLLHYRDDLLVGPGVAGLHRTPQGDVELVDVTVDPVVP